MDRFYQWLATRLPWRLIYWSTVRAIAGAAASPRHSKKSVGRLKALQVLDWMNELI